MFNKSAHWYDAFYARLDYEAEARQIVGLVHHIQPQARTLLDVACGTGRHLSFLRNAFDCEGVDIEPSLLRVAAARLPGVTLTLGDMTRLDLGRRFDVVTCLFSSIGYVVTDDRLDLAVRAMAAHLDQAIGHYYDTPDPLRARGEWSDSHRGRDPRAWVVQPRALPLCIPPGRDRSALARPRDTWSRSRCRHGHRSRPAASFSLPARGRSSEGVGLMYIDADGHVMEPHDVWVGRMDEKRWGDLIPRYVAEDFDGKDSWYVGGVRRAAGSAIFGCSAGFDPEELLSRSWKYTEGHAAAWDPVERVRMLDEEGIDATVLYPSLALTFGPLDPIEAVRDPQFVAAMHRAYNDWMAEFCATAPTRLFAAAPVPLQDIDLAVAEARRAVADLGAKAIMVRSAAYVDELPFSHRVYDPFWATCQELGVPVGFHPATHTDLPNAARLFKLIRQSADMAVANKQSDDVVGGTAMSIAIGAPVDAIVTLGRLIMGGVCERFPDLKLLILESGGGWAASILERMDEELHANPQEARWLELTPSEYFRRQCWISFEPNDPTLPRLADLIGIDRILWASDFAHSDAVYPGTVKALDDCIAPLDARAQDQIRGANAVAAYRLAG